MSGKRLPTGKHWEADALAAVPADYATNTYLPVVVANPVGGQPPVLGFTSSLGGGFVPTYIAPGEIFTLPDNRQAIYAMTIDNEGTIDIGDNSYLIGVELP